MADTTKPRCINIDWLECYCIENPSQSPCDAQYFRDRGWSVIERPYGTRQYSQMFTLLDRHDEPFIEIRREPVAAENSSLSKGIFSPFSCHIRLTNKWCYTDDAVSVYSEFLARYEYEIQRLYRLDICLDFEKFDSGDDPHKFMLRYLQGRYSKINQTNYANHGKDRWEKRDPNSISWGAPTSMVSTKFYNKTLELAEQKDKPYIRVAWQNAGLVDDYVTLTRKSDDGNTYKPTIWRVEFSIKSSARAWFIYEDCNGAKTKKLTHEHTLGLYATKDNQLKAFAFLAHHYFHFKKYIDGQRKDRCPDKVLFNFALNHQVYKLDVLASSTPVPQSIDVLARKLREYRIAHPQRDVQQACDVLLAMLDTEAAKKALPYAATEDDAKLYQHLIALRIKQNPKEPLSESIATAQAMIEIERNLF